MYQDSKRTCTAIVLLIKPFVWCRSRRRRRRRRGLPRANLHGTTLSHATSLRQVYDMTQDHLQAHDIFTYKIKYAKVCTGIFGAKVLANGKQIFQLSCALKNLSYETFFALIRSLLALFKKRLHVNQSTTTSSTVLKQENFSFVPDLTFLSISATIVAAFSNMF